MFLRKRIYIVNIFLINDKQFCSSDKFSQSALWKYYSFPLKSIFNRSNIFFLFREIVKLISLSIYIDKYAKLIN